MGVVRKNKIKNMFEIETGLIFWNIVSFLILLFVLQKWALPPILAAIKKREETIARAIEAAEESRKKSEELLARHKKKLHEAQEDAQIITRKAKADAEKIRASMVERASKQANAIIDQSKFELAEEKNRILQEAKKEITEMAVLAASKVIGRNVSSADNQKIVEEFIK